MLDPLSQTPRVLSGMQPTHAQLHIGNYEGALKQLVQLQKNHEVFCMIADYHAMTTLAAHPEKIRDNCFEITKDYLAAGMNPDQSIIFRQSSVPQHAELHLILSMIAKVGELERIPTYKENRDSSEEGVCYGLLGYPVLQSADILLYRPKFVPVGKDQAPHLELSRDIAERFNRMYGNIFPDFEYIGSGLINVMGTDGRKMSKSRNNGIYLSDSEDETAKKIMGAFTTPTKIKASDPGVPEFCSVCQLLKIYSPTAEVQLSEDAQGLRGCVKNKKELIEIINESFREIRERRKQITVGQTNHALRLGTVLAKEFAESTMIKIRERLSFS